MSSFRSLAFASASACLFGLVAAPADAQSVAYRTPNVTTAAGAQSVTLGGATFVNQGLVGVGRLSATTRDFAGETLGSFSAMSVDASSWRRNADGSYSGKIWTLPDRGPNDVGPFVGTTDYRNRIHVSDIKLTPYAGTANLPASTSSQSQLSITPDSGFFLTDATGLNFTGKDAGSNVITRNGVLYPSPASGEGAGRISLDSEGVARLADGSFYISDEYAAGLYYFDASGRQIGAIQTVSALLPRTGGVVNFNGGAAPTTGRRNNQGLEAVAVTPDGQRLVTILQSATLQDTGSGNQGRNNTRILVYDISQTRTPTAPVEHYVLQLPVLTTAGDGGAPNATAAQSEMLALNSNQFLVLSRDGIGRGADPNAANSPVFKSVLLVDTTGATNIAGTTYETAANGAVSPGGALNAAIKPVQQVQLVNMLNPVQLGKFGMNLKTAPSDLLSLSEKWEAMGLLPTLEEKAPQDFFLLVGNDNDFMTANGRINGQDFDASLTGVRGSGNNDNVILVYRLTLPTYVDPLALQAMRLGAPVVAGMSLQLAEDLGGAAAAAGFGEAAAARRAAQLGAAFAPGLRLWAQGGWSQSLVNGVAVDDEPSGDGPRVALGADFTAGPVRVGAAAAYGGADVEASGFRAKSDAASFSFYGSYVGPSGLYVQAAAGGASNVNFDELARPAAYGLTGTGTAKADVLNARLEAGWSRQMGPVRLGPFVAARTSRVMMKAYTESGASLGNAAYGNHDATWEELAGGLEVAGRFGGLVPSLRVSYVGQRSEVDPLTVRLASAQHAMGQQVLDLGDLAHDRTEAEFSLAGEGRGFSWRLDLAGRFSEQTAVAGAVTVAKSF
ncbi:esterase-like activity of phytase family protein [Phenylobacterium sp. LjRoot225]|uniref:esterase-like activity of phytase family protein n=1 Tax=Phenylobacterium sp. LjRoot225 TaxID=3342285 RepID=UPI003ED06729